jgi:hypothetical protein
MEFKLSGTVCADGGNCQPLDASATNLTNWRRDATRAFDPDSSWSSVNISFLNTLQNPPNTLVISNYSAGIQSNVRGGYWKEKFLGVVTKTGDGTSTVNYTLRGNAKIPVCTDTSKCSPTVNVWNNVYPGAAEKGATLALTVDGPTGKRDLPPFGVVQIDRTLGDHQIEATLSRSGSHTGGCCHEWVPQSFVVSVSKISASPPPFVSSKNAGAGALNLPPWLDAEVFSDLGPFNAIGGQLAIRMGSSVGLPALDFASPISQVSLAYDRRHTSLWPRLIFSRLALEWGEGSLTAAEKNQLAAINATATSQARQSLTGALQAELNAYAFALEALDPTPLILVMAALVRDTDITVAINDAELKLVGRIADASQRASPVGESLKEAKEALDYVRAGSPRVDALLRLSAAEQLLSHRARYAKERSDRLARELAQLWVK